MSWLMFPDLVATSSREKLEAAAKLSYCGHLQQSVDLFRGLRESDPSAVVLFEFETAYSTRALFDEAEELAKSALEALGTERSCIPFALTLRLEYAFVRMHSRGHHGAAQSEADDIRDEYQAWLMENAFSSEAELGVLLRYYVIVSNNRAVSNWRDPEDLYILTDNLEGECAKLREHSARYDTTFMGCKILRAMLVLLEEPTQKAELLRKVIEKTSQISRRQSARDKYHAANMMLQCGAILGDLSEAESARQCLQQSEFTVRTLSQDPAFAGGPSSFPLEYKDEKALEIPWRQQFPRLAFLKLSIEAKISSNHDPDKLSSLADLASYMSDQHWEVSYRIQAMEAAEAKYTMTKDECAFAVRQSTQADLLRLIRSKACLSKHMHSMVLGIMGNQLDSSTHSSMYSQCKRFLDDLQGFDSPLDLFSIFSCLLDAAKALEMPHSEIYEYQVRVQYYFKSCPGMVRETPADDPGYSLKDEIRKEEQRQEPNRRLTWTFERCLKAMTIWASEQIKSGTSTKDQWAQIILAHVNETDRQNVVDMDEVDLRKVILGAFGDERSEAEADAFFAVDAHAWLIWIEAVQTWLSQVRSPENSERCDSVLIRLIKARISTRQLHMIRLASKPTSLFACMESSIAERVRHFELVQSANPYALDRENARADLTDGISDFAMLSGILGQPVMQEQLFKIEMDSMAEADVQNCPGWRIIQASCYQSAAKACWVRFLHHGRDKKVLDGLFQLFDKIDGCVREAYQLRFLFGTSDQLEKSGYTALQGSNPATITERDSTEKPLEVCTKVIKDMFPHTDHRTTLENSDVEVLQLLKRLTLWVQRSKGRAMMELLNETDALPYNSLLETVSMSEATKELLERERFLMEKRDSVEPQDREVVVENLVQCRQQMLQEPELARITEWRLATSASFDDIQAVLREYKKTAVLVDWFQVDGEVWFQSHRLGMRFMPVLVTDLNVQQLLAWQARHIQRVNTPFATDEALEALASLQLLIQPLIEITDPSETIIICPSRATQGIPLHALSIDGTPLIERNPIAYIQSVAQLRRALTQHKSQGHPVHHGTLICPLKEDPNVSQGQLATLFSSLSMEKPGIGLKNLPGPLSKSAVLGALRENDTATMLGHATFEIAAPLQSGFRLAQVSADDGDSRLTAADIFRAKVRPGAVVLQMGCRSGVSEVNEMGTHLGLDAALFFAGAASVVSTLWRVLDADAFDFLQTFYTAWKAESVAEREVDLAHVMWQTVREMRSREDGKRAFHWAAFVLNGAWVGWRLALGTD